MCAGVARSAHRNQVLFAIIAGVAAKLFVMDLQVRHRAARLTPPGIATQDLLPQPLVDAGSSRKPGGAQRIALMKPSRSILPEMSAVAPLAET